MFRGSTKTTSNKDFRIATKEEIPPDSVDFVLVLDFPEPRVRGDEPVVALALALIVLAAAAPLSLVLLAAGGSGGQVVTSIGSSTGTGGSGSGGTSHNKGSGGFTCFDVIESMPDNVDI